MSWANKGNKITFVKREGKHRFTPLGSSLHGTNQIVQRTKSENMRICTPHPDETGLKISKGKTIASLKSK